MPRYKLSTSADISLTAATLKTALQLVAPATRRLLLCGIEVEFASVTQTDVSGLVQLALQTTAGTMTARTPSLIDQAETASLATGQENATAEPTQGTVLAGWKVSPVGGLFVYDFPEKSRILMAVSTRLGLGLNFPQAQSGVRAALIFEE